MSYVTNVIVSIGILERVGREALESWDSGRYAEHGRRDEFKRLDEAEDGWGGSKHPEVTLFAGAFNWLDLDELKRFIAEVRWEHPDEVQLFVYGQHESKWTVSDLSEIREPARA